MRRKLDVMADRLNEAFREAMDAAAWTHLAIRTLTSWDIFVDGLVTSRVDGKPLTFNETNFIRGYSAGYADAMDMVRREANGGG